MSARCLSAALWSSIFALLFCTPARAQSQQHSLTVRVADPAGAPVARRAGHGIGARCAAPDRTRDR